MRANYFSSLAEITQKHLNPDFISITETWFSDATNLENFVKPGYKFFTCNRITAMGGGVTCYAKSTLSPVTSMMSEENEALTVRIKCKNKYFHISTFYRAPKKRKSDYWQTLDEIKNKLKDRHVI